MQDSRDIQDINGMSDNSDILDSRDMLDINNIQNSSDMR
jgi:hypothetical protein